MWGFFTFQSSLVPIASWFGRHLSFVPGFQVSGTDPSFVGSGFVAGIVVGIMITPIITSVSRDVMAQVPREQCEGALALGGTRWGMIRDVILPFGRSGILGATLLGFGRALGETIAVALLVVLSIRANFHVLERGAGSVAALIALHFKEASTIERSALVGAGLALFLLTLAVNLIARKIVSQAGRFA
jgi:phosphate transport system permease protein